MWWRTHLQKILCCSNFAWFNTSMGWRGAATNTTHFVSWHFDLILPFHYDGPHINETVGSRHCTFLTMKTLVPSLLEEICTSIPPNLFYSIQPYPTPIRSEPSFQVGGVECHIHWNSVMQLCVSIDTQYDCNLNHILSLFQYMIKHLACTWTQWAVHGVLCELLIAKEINEMKSGGGMWVQ